MNIHYLQRVPFEGLGSIEDWARSQSGVVGATRLYRGESLPALEKVDLLIVMGGPMNIYEETRYPRLLTCLVPGPMPMLRRRLAGSQLR